MIPAAPAARLPAKNSIQRTALRAAADAEMTVTGKITGYDPGGNDQHGVAALVVSNGRPIRLSFASVRNAEAALRWFTADGMPLATGIDALTLLSTGNSGWRPADRWLREQYQQVQGSVVNPNNLKGAMALNGLAVMVWLRNANKNILISETHPKVLYFHLSEVKYDYAAKQKAMNSHLAQWIGLGANTANDHEWDAVLSCYAVLEGMSGRWSMDLHQLPPTDGESLVQPGGPSHYYWPVLNEKRTIDERPDLGSPWVDVC
ncbi:MAG: hypothetical protein DDT21_00869 [Syntrophomonadaceae bacterium]|nr:hypothetical protein [Bacillota bacterium]